ncbi:Outer membrane efflux protein [Desulfonema magnum]|uniref:Outer membrane efflux protein n=2 Tax=Desulfonema magnum TaxID=45655 RepID=A0A975BIC0_9BACT|nr:Outer membrane efflux protein [Desulfonema magnum]
MRFIFSFPLFPAIGLTILFPVIALGANHASKEICLETRTLPQSPNPSSRDVSQEAHTQAEATIANVSQEARTEIELTIADVSRKALGNNLDLRIEKFAPRISEEQVRAAEADFDPDMSFGGTLTRTYADTDLSEIDSRGEEMSAAIGKRFSSGIQTSVGVSASKSKTDVNTVGETDEYATSANLTLTLPLLKNRGREVNTRNISLSRNNHKIAELTLRQTAIDTISQAQILYWNLYKAQQELDVQKKSLELAKKFSELSRGRAKIGHIASIDTLQADAEVAAREEWVIIAENDVRNRRRSLLYFILGRCETGITVKLLQKPTYEKAVFDENRLFLSALENRTDYLIAKLDIKNAETNVVYAKNQTLPTGDLSATLSVNGLGESWGKAYENAGSGEDYSGSLGISLEFPWGMKKDKAAHQIALYENRRSRTRLFQAEQNILSDVRTALDNLTEADKRYHTTTLSKQLAEKKLSAEERKFGLGLSTSYNVLLYQRDLTDAAVRTISAVIDYQLALIHLDRVTGMTLERHAIGAEEF